MYRTIEKHTKSRKSIQIIGRDFNAELEPGTDVERVSAGPLQNPVALNTMYRKMHEKQNTYIAPKRTEKQLDYIFFERMHLGCSRDAEANDMIHMGSDHESVMATFVIKAQRKNDSRETRNDKQRSNTVKTTKEHTDDKGSKEAITFEERYQKFEEKIKYKAGAAEVDQKNNAAEAAAETKKRKQRRKMKWKRKRRWRKWKWQMKQMKHQHRSKK